MFWKTWIRKQLNISSFPSWPQKLHISAAAWWGLEVESPIVSFCPWRVRPQAQATSPAPRHGCRDDGETSERVVPVQVESPREVNHRRQRRLKPQTQLCHTVLLQKPGSYWTELKQNVLAQRKATEPIFPVENSGECFSHQKVILTQSREVAVLLFDQQCPDAVQTWLDKTVHF